MTYYQTAYDIAPGAAEFRAALAALPAARVARILAARNVDPDLVGLPDAELRAAYAATQLGSPASIAGALSTLSRRELAARPRALAGGDRRALRRRAGGRSARRNA